MTWNIKSYNKVSDLWDIFRKNNPDKDIYSVIGRFKGLDCGYYGYKNDSGIKFCIPLIDIIDIDLIK